LAIINSSFVGTTNTFTFESALEKAKEDLDFSEIEVGDLFSNEYYNSIRLDENFEEYVCMKFSIEKK